MKVPALIMAGGKGTRMGLPTEKPLLPLLGKPLIDWVAKAVESAKNVSEFYVVTSPNTPDTERHCQNRDWKVLRTDAKGYHNDLKQAAQMARLTGPVLSVPADSPAVTGKFLDKIISQFEACSKDFFAVFVPIKAREELGLINRLYRRVHGQVVCDLRSQYCKRLKNSRRRQNRNGRTNHRRTRSSPKH